MSMMEEELKLLKDELKALKECQTRYVSLAVTSVGLILSYMAKNGIDTSNQFNAYETQNVISIIWLIPIIILLPFSRIFFDKATTITRIVGYYQILEGFNKGKYPLYKYIGWENSLSVLRTSIGRSGEKKIKKSAGTKLWEEESIWNKILFLFSTVGLNFKKETELKPMNGYWRLIYIIFCSLVAFCLVLSIFPIMQSICDNGLFLTFRANELFFLITLSFLIFSASVFKHNLKMLYQLERGFHSYAANRVLWETIILSEKKTIDDIIKNTKLEPVSALNKLFMFVLLLVVLILPIFILVFFI